MKKRFVSIWFHHLKTDWFARHKERLELGNITDQPFVVAQKSHGKMLITAINKKAESQGITHGMAVADARAIVKNIVVVDDIPLLEQKVLRGLAEWSIRFSPIVTSDVPDGLIIDATGCSHLWGGEKEYLRAISNRIKEMGYGVRISMADTIGCAWAVARFGKLSSIVEPGKELEALQSLPSISLRLEEQTIARLNKLGLRQVNDFIAMPRVSLRRRFGDHMIKRLNQALGYEEEFIESVIPIEIFEERLPSIDPISTRKGIEIALERLIEQICSRLMKEGKGLRQCVFKGYRIDGKMQTLQISTNMATHNATHIFKLFEICLNKFEPGPGVELFSLQVQKLDDVIAAQEELWTSGKGLEDQGLSQLLDRISGRFGKNAVSRYLPDEHFWPERSIKLAASLTEKATSDWKAERPRPVQLLATPEKIEVMAPVPDYPPMQFRYNNKLHKIQKADGPERIEQEWWIQQGEHRDYYYVEDEEGKRYWLFRSGHYTGDKTHQWFLHGFFA
jgi:protein ImuB